MTHHGKELNLSSISTEGRTKGEAETLLYANSVLIVLIYSLSPIFKIVF